MSPTPPPVPPARPPALLASIALGGLGLLLLVLGMASGAAPLFVAGFVAGALSLGAALYWRSQLIEAWRDERREPEEGGER